MDQLKVGVFIATKRKEHNLTQVQLAEKLGITDRAISKWERGKSLPDASIMLELCEILEITVNDLLCGEVVMDNYNEKIENNMIEVIKQKEDSDKRLLKMEIFIGIISTMFLFSLIAIGIVFVKVYQKQWVFFLLFGLGVLQFLVSMFFAIRIEQKAGYYVCAKCGHRYIPKYASVLFSMHVNRTRYMKCPNCGKRSWQKKAISKE